MSKLHTQEGEPKEEFGMWKMMPGMIGILMMVSVLPYLSRGATVPFNPWAYDTDGDCYISIPEALVAVNDCHYGRISEAQRDEVVYLWQNSIENPSCVKVG